MKRTAMKAVLAILAGVFGVGTAAAEGSGGSSFFDQLLSEVLAKVSQNLPPEVNQALLEFLGSTGILG